jgi:hypothetical protein
MESTLPSRQPGMGHQSEHAAAAQAEPNTSARCRAYSHLESDVRAPRATGEGRSDRSCTWPLRVNISGSSFDHHRNKKVYTRELSWHPSSPLTPGDSLDAGRADTQRPLRSPSLTLPTTTACSYPHWLWPGWHTKQQHFAQRPDMVGQPRRHSGRRGPPLLRGAAAVGALGLRQGQA